MLPMQPEDALAAGPHLQILGIALIFICLMILTNAILHYVGVENSSGVPSRAELEAIVRAMLEENARNSRDAAQLPVGHERERRTEADIFLTEENLSAIAGTLKAFRG